MEASVGLAIDFDALLLGYSATYALSVLHLYKSKRVGPWVRRISWIR